MSVIKSISVGHGDMFYIRHGSDNFTIIGCNLFEDDKVTIVNELKKESKGKGIVRFYVDLSGFGAFKRFKVLG